MKIIENKTFDEERALYDAHDIVVRNCAFDGPADGESAFKECGSITVEHCFSISGIRFGMIKVWN